MKLDTNIIIVFLLAIFGVLLITSSGMSLNDEWMTAAELNQIYQGHQFIYNEGKYGYYANGTIGAYMEWRYNRLMYPIALPLVSLPMMFLFGAMNSTFRLGILLMWMLCGLFLFILIFKKSHGNRKGHFIKRDYYAVAALGILTAAAVANRFLYSPFPFSGPWVPGEVVAITMTNVILFGALAATVYATAKELWPDTLTDYVATAIAMVCSSAIFWTTTTKDHILVMFLVAVIALLFIKYYKYGDMKYVAISALLSGVLTWVRPEIGFGLIIASVLIPAMRKENTWKATTVALICVAIGLIPFFLNNLVVTGDLFVTPFMAANRGYSDYLSYSYLMQIHNVSPSMSNLGLDVVKTAVGPYSGAAGLLVIIPLIIFIPVGWAKTKKLTDVETILIVTALASILIHLYKGTIIMQQADLGIFPDLRYFTPLYTTITLASLSVIFRSFDINIKRLLKNWMVFALMITIMLILAILMFANYFSVQAHFNLAMSLVSMAAVGMTLIMAVNDIRNRTKYVGNIAIPLLVSIPFAWNFITTFLYNGIKIAGYPMLLPLSEYLYNLIF